MNKASPFFFPENVFGEEKGDEETSKRKKETSRKGKSGPRLVQERQEAMVISKNGIVVKREPFRGEEGIWAINVFLFFLYLWSIL